jgi:hypothetical protein
MTLERDFRGSVLKDIERVHGPDGFVDVTERVKCYEKGKVWKCDCGQDIGVSLNMREVVCATCGKNNIDLEWTRREPNETQEQRQTSLGDF